MAEDKNTKKRTHAENVEWVNNKNASISTKAAVQCIIKRAGLGKTEEKLGNQMGFWPDAVAAMPTELTRVSLFGLPSDKPGARKLLDDTKLDSRGDIEILYSGKQLCVKDETAWLACLRLGRDLPMGQRIPLQKVDLLRECKLKNTGPNWKTFERRLDRLSKAHFTINFKRGDKTYHMTTGMLNWGIENETGSFYIRLDPDGAALFENLSYQPWQIRLSLESDVATRLLSYVSGHEQGKPHKQTLKNLKNWCGYSGELGKFSTKCFIGLSELEAKGILVKGSVNIATGLNGKIACWVREKAKNLSAQETKL